MRSLVLILSAASIACADMESLADSGYSGGVDDTGSSDGDTHSTDSMDTAAEDPFVPAWVTLTAAGTVTEGLPVAEGATASFSLADAAIKREDCDPITGSGFVADDPPAMSDGTQLFAWWTMRVVADSGCETFAVDTAVGFGIGELDPEVRARLGTVGLEGEAESLLGAWFSLGDDDSSSGQIAPFPFGYAQVSDPVGTDAPLPDGQYTLQPLLLVAIPAE